MSGHSDLERSSELPSLPPTVPSLRRSQEDLLTDGPPSSPKKESSPPMSYRPNYACPSLHTHICLPRQEPA